MRFLHKNHHHLASHCVHYVYSLKPWSFAAAFLPRSIKGVAKLQQVLKPLSWEKSLQALVQMHCQHFLAFKTPESLKGNFLTLHHWVILAFLITLMATGS